MKDLLRSCHGHGLGKGNIIQILYHSLNDATQAILDDEGIFLYKTPNETRKLLEDRVLLKLDWSKDMKAEPQSKTIAFTESNDTSKLMEKMEALTTKIDSQFKEIKGEMKEMNSGNWHDRQTRDDHRYSPPNEEECPIPSSPKKKLEETNFKKTMRELIVAQRSSNDFVKNQFFNLKTKVEQGLKNHQAAIQDLETKFG
nr:reverse transcriptase domain-containing protein [Tanacetum cinerariifolium]